MVFSRHEKCVIYVWGFGFFIFYFLFAGFKVLLLFLLKFVYVNVRGHWMVDDWVLIGNQIKKRKKKKTKKTPNSLRWRLLSFGIQVYMSLLFCRIVV